MRERRLAAAILLFATAATVATVALADAGVSVAVSAESVAVGDPVTVTVTLALPADAVFDPPAAPAELGPFEVVASSWTAPARPTEAPVWTWVATLRHFRIGTHRIPEMRFDVGVGEYVTDPIEIDVVGVVDDAEWESGEPELADLKPPATLPPDYTALWIALATLGTLLLGALLAWWLQRRYADRLAAVETPADPFARLAPHEWIYRELQALLERRLPESGNVDTFYEELSRIVKRYVAGRFRVDLLERTTGEVRSTCADAGVPAEAIDDLLAVLGEADAVKFAGARPSSEAWRASVERVYRLVDRTRPRDAAPPAATPSASAPAAREAS